MSDTIYQKGTFHTGVDKSRGKNDYSHNQGSIEISVDSAYSKYMDKAFLKEVVETIDQLLSTDAIPEKNKYLVATHNGNIKVEAEKPKPNLIKSLSASKIIVGLLSGLTAEAVKQVIKLLTE